MEHTKINLKSETEWLSKPLSTQAIKDAVYVDDSRLDYGFVVSYVTVSGKYNREYKIVAFCVPLSNERVLVEDDLLIICLWSNLLVIDLNADKLIKNIKFSGYEMFRIFKFKDGYFIYGEGENRFLKQNFDLVWEAGCADIFINPKVEKELEIFADCVTVFDWCGYKHFYNEKGEFKTEYYPQYKI